MNKKLLIILSVVAALALLGTCAYRGVTAGLEGWARAQENTGIAIDAAMTDYGEDWDPARLAPHATPAMMISLASNPIVTNSITDMLRRYVGPLATIEERACTNFSTNATTETGRQARAECYAVIEGELGRARFALLMDHNGEVWRVERFNASIEETSVPVEPSGTLKPETAPSAN